MPELSIGLSKTAQGGEGAFSDMDAKGDQHAYYEDVTADGGFRKAPQSDFRNSTRSAFLREAAASSPVELSRTLFRAAPVSVHGREPFLKPAPGAVTRV